MAVCLILYPHCPLGGSYGKHDLLMLNLSNLKMAAKVCMIWPLPNPYAVFLCSLHSSFGLNEPPFSK